MPGQGARVFVPRPWAILATGDRDGDSLREIVEINCRCSSSARQDSDDGVGARLTNSPRALPTRRHPVAVVATFAATYVAIRTSTGKMLFPLRRRRPWDVSCAASEGAPPPGMKGI